MGSAFSGVGRPLGEVTAALGEDHWKHMASAVEDGRCDLC